MDYNLSLDNDKDTNVNFRAKSHACILEIMKPQGRQAKKEDHRYDTQIIGCAQFEILEAKENRKRKGEGGANCIQGGLPKGGSDAVGRMAA